MKKLLFSLSIICLSLFAGQVNQNFINNGNSQPISSVAFGYITTSPTPSHTHTFMYKSVTSTKHLKYCKNCSYNVQNDHTFNNKNICIYCNYKKISISPSPTPSHTHNFEKSYVIVNDTYHKLIISCSSCQNTLLEKQVKHNFTNNVCDCGFIKCTHQEKNGPYTGWFVDENNNSIHYTICELCNSIVRSEKHDVNYCSKCGYPNKYIPTLPDDSAIQKNINPDSTWWNNALKDGITMTWNGKEIHLSPNDLITITNIQVGEANSQGKIELALNIFTESQYSSLEEAIINSYVFTNKLHNNKTPYATQSGYDTKNLNGNVNDEIINVLYNSLQNTESTIPVDAHLVYAGAKVDRRNHYFDAMATMAIYEENDVKFLLTQDDPFYAINYAGYFTNLYASIPVRDVYKDGEKLDNKKCLKCNSHLASDGYCFECDKGTDPENHPLCPEINTEFGKHHLTYVNDIGWVCFYCTSIDKNGYNPYNHIYN